MDIMRHQNKCFEIGTERLHAQVNFKTAFILFILSKNLSFQ